MNTEAVVENNEAVAERSEEVMQNEVKRGRGRPKKHKDIPTTLTCSITGMVVKTTPTQFKKQLERSGLDLATFMKTYVCRAAKTALKNKANAQTNG
jgi:hypothetical protein